MQDKEFYWFVGIFEGEGTFTFHKNKPKRLAICMTDLDVLEKVQKIVGGTVAPLAKRKEHWKQAWLWTLCGENSVAVAKAMLPFLGQRRAVRCTEYIENFSTLSQHREAQQIKKEKLVEHILDLRSKGMTHKSISERLDLDRSYVTKILNNYGVYGVVALHTAL